MYYRRLTENPLSHSLWGEPQGGEVLGYLSHGALPKTQPNWCELERLLAQARRRHGLLPEENDVVRVILEVLPHLTR